MKKIILLFSFLLLVTSHKLIAQNTICDSISVDSVYIDNNLLVITVYNSSQHFIVYPYFTLSLTSNNYIQLNDSVLVLSYLSSPGDANNGFSTGTYIANIAAANMVPLNTLFTGLLTITNPNDSTFSCSFPFSFLYGTMPTLINENSFSNYSIFPNPATESITISRSTWNQKNNYSIFDQFGKLVASGVLINNQNKIDVSQIEAGIYTLQIADVKPFTYKIAILEN